MEFLLALLLATTTSLASPRTPFPSPPLLLTQPAEPEWFRQRLDHFNIKDPR